MEAGSSYNHASSCGTSRSVPISVHVHNDNELDCENREIGVKSMTRSYDNGIDKRQQLSHCQSHQNLQTYMYIAAVMKIVFVLTVLIGAAISEDCTSVSDCSHVACPERDYELICDHTICSCEQTTPHTCMSANDCQNSAPGTGNHCWRDFHCVDGTCRCGHEFGPAPGGGHAPGGGPAPGDK